MSSSPDEPTEFVSEGELTIQRLQHELRTLKTELLITREERDASREERKRDRVRLALWLRENCPEAFVRAVNAGVL